jgi:hypothetical protein
VVSGAGASWARRQEGNEKVKSTVLQQVEQCRQWPVAALRAKYQELFGEPTHCRQKRFLWRRIAWRLQANVYGDLSPETRRHALNVADDRDLRRLVPAAGSRVPRATDLRLPLPGTVLTRSFQGRTIKVCVLPDGFRYRDRRFRSLSAVAEHITGTRWNGYRFWGLEGRRVERRG